MASGAARQPGARHGDPNVVALLSLKLILLGFFILLNALSEYEESRTRMVLESVNEAFNGRVDAPESFAPFSAGLGPLEQGAAMMEDVGRLFRSLIPAVRSEHAADRGRLLLELPSETLFRPAGVALQPGRDLLLRRFAAALTSDGRLGLDFEVELLHGTAGDTSAAPSAATGGTLEMRRLGALVRLLVRLGVPARKLSVGLLPGRPGRVRLVVQAYHAPLASPDYREYER
jgi:hypothetical protein